MPAGTGRRRKPPVEATLADAEPRPTGRRRKPPADAPAEPVLPVAAAVAAAPPAPSVKHRSAPAVPPVTAVRPAAPPRPVRPLRPVPVAPVATGPELGEAPLAELAPVALAADPVEFAPRSSHRKPKSKFAGLPSPTTLVAGAAVVAVAAGTVASAAGGAALQDDSAAAVAQSIETPILVAPAPVKSEQQLRAEAEAAREKAVKASRQRARAALDARKKAAAELKRQETLAAKAAEAARIRAARIIELAKSFRLPVSGYRITAHYGEHGLWSSGHTGVDFACSYGTPIRAVASGTIVEAGWDGAYGWKTVIRLKDGTEHWYAHQSSFAKRQGWVNAGDIIGRVGSTGRTTGPHLHFEVRINGEPINPLAWLRARGLHP